MLFQWRRGACTFAKQSTVLSVHSICITPKIEKIKCRIFLLFLVFFLFHYIINTLEKNQYFLFNSGVGLGLIPAMETYLGDAAMLIYKSCLKNDTIIDTYLHGEFGDPVLSQRDQCQMGLQSWIPSFIGFFDKFMATSWIPCTIYLWPFAICTF